MAKHTVRYESPEQFVRIPASAAPSSFDCDGWHIEESVAEAFKELAADGIRSYRVILEREVISTDEVNKALGDACDLADELELAWCVLCGWPFENCGRHVHMQEAPAGWRGNTRAIADELEQEETGFVCVQAAQAWTYRCVAFPFMPLTEVVNIRAKLRVAPVELVELATLYRRAIIAKWDGLMALSKALEIVGQRHGQSRDQRNKGLQAFIDNYFQPGTITLAATELFNLANERFETRHGVARTDDFSLLPKMTPAEAKDFASSASRTVRGFICNKLNTKFVISPHQ